MKKFSKNDIVVSAIAVILVVAVASVLGILRISGAICSCVNPFLLMLTVLTLGIGVYTAIFGAVRKGGYELSVGLILSIIGVVLLLVTLKVYFVIIIIVGVALLIIAPFILLLAKAKSLAVARTNESPDFVPYNEQLKIQKQEEKEREDELPEIKSFKD